MDVTAVDASAVAVAVAVAGPVQNIWVFYTRERICFEALQLLGTYEREG